MCFYLFAKAKKEKKKQKEKNFFKKILPLHKCSKNAPGKTPPASTRNSAAANKSYNICRCRRAFLEAQTCQNKENLPGKKRLTETDG